MAGLADHKGLASPFGHECHPRRLRPSRLVEVGELADVVNFDLAGVLAHLTPSRSEPVDQLLAAEGDRGEFAVGEDRVLVAP